MRLQDVLALTAMLGVGTVPALATDPPRLIQISHVDATSAHAFPFGISDDGHVLGWVLSNYPGDGRWHVMVGDDDGANQREVVSMLQFNFSGYGEDCGGISMSGDGLTIAYGSGDDPLGTNEYGACQIFLVNTDGTNLRQLTTHAAGYASDPSVNHDGSVIAYTGDYPGDASILAYHAANGTTVGIDPVPRNGEGRFDPQIDSTGDHVALQATRVIGFAIRFGARGTRADGSQRHDLTPFVTNTTFLDAIHISRDGSTVLYSSVANFTGENPGGSDLNHTSFQAFVVPWEGGLIRQITDASQVQNAFASEQPMLADGSRAALSVRFKGSDEECAMVWVDTAGGATEEITPRSSASCLNFAPEVSADGRVLFFGSIRVTSDNPTGVAQVFVFRYDSSEQPNSPPTAMAGQDQTIECNGNSPAVALLDGSASTDPDSTSGTNDDIVAFDWFEDYGLPSEATLGSGEQLQLSFASGVHHLTLRVQDNAGATGVASVTVTVQGPTSCDDGNECTADGINPVCGCDHVPTPGVACTDENACTSADSCDAGGLCVGGSPTDCDDSNLCTDETCNPATGCILTNNTKPCNDGNACTTNDTCGGGVCTAGDPTDCDDGNCCTIDSCDPAFGCLFSANTTAPAFTTQPTLNNAILWPPNHGYADFTVADAGAVTSSSCGIASIQFASCGSSQSENGTGTGDGNSTRDCVYEPGALHLRAERDGACSPIGRVYATTIIVLDVCGNVTTSSPLVVGVFHDRGNGPTSGTIVHGSGNQNDTRNGTNGTYGTDCGLGSGNVNGTTVDHSDADPEMEISQDAAVSVGDLRLDSASGGNVKLTWTDPTLPSSIHVTRYHVYRIDPLTLFWTQIAEVSKATTVYLDPVLSDGSNWQYKVTAVIK